MNLRLLFPCVLLHAFIVESLASAPWQDTSSNVLQESLYNDLPPTVFAPSGRLFSIERMMQAVSNPQDPSSNLVIAIHCKEGIVVVSTEPQSPYLHRYRENNTTTTASEAAQNSSRTPLLLLDEDSWIPPAPFSRLSSHLWGVTAGNAVDSQILRRKLQLHAEAFREALEDCQPHIMARRLADNLQLSTQQAGKGRILACSAVLVSEDQIWRVDPTGQFWKCRAVVVGRGSVKAEQELLARICKSEKSKESTPAEAIHKRIAEWSMEEALLAARDCIRCALSVKPDDKDQQKIRLRGMTLAGSKVMWLMNDEMDMDSLGTRLKPKS